MSLIINGATMPMSCLDCPCLRHDVTEGINSYQCNVTLRTFTSDLPDGRAHDCPLSSPDGEIDKELEEFCAKTKCCDQCIMRHAFRNCGKGWHIRYSSGNLNEAAHAIIIALKMIKEEERNEKN